MLQNLNLEAKGFWGFKFQNPFAANQQRLKRQFFCLFEITFQDLYKLKIIVTEQQINISFKIFTFQAKKKYIVLTYALPVSNLSLVSVQRRQQNDRINRTLNDVISKMDTYCHFQKWLTEMQTSNSYLFLLIGVATILGPHSLGLLNN